jgi:hypothetical protein
MLVWGGVAHRLMRHVVLTKDNPGLQKTYRIEINEI